MDKDGSTRDFRPDQVHPTGDERLLDQITRWARSLPVARAEGASADGNEGSLGEPLESQQAP